MSYSINSCRQTTSALLPFKNGATRSACLERSIFSVTSEMPADISARAIYRRFDECVEKRVRGERTRLEFWMELRTDVERMLRARQFGDFFQIATFPPPRKDEACFLQLPDIHGANLKAVTVALGDYIGAGYLTDERAFLQVARVCSEAHRTTIVFARELF